MEEDIKILEQFKEFLINIRIPSCNFEKEIKAIENLIKGYRELEKDLHEMTISNNHKKENWVHKNCLNEYIPKSKIREKIKPVIDSLEKDGFVGYADELRDVLEELLEEK